MRILNIEIFVFFLLFSPHHTRFVLTAGHCFNGLPGSTVRVTLGRNVVFQFLAEILKLFLGEYDTEIREDEQQFRATYVVHPQYKNNNGRSLIYDFAILRLDREVKFTTEISPVCLPSVSLGLEGSQGTVVGWGNQRLQERRVGVEGLVKGFGYQLSTILQELDIRSWCELLTSCHNFVSASPQPASVG